MLYMLLTVDVYLDSSLKIIDKVVRIRLINAVLNWIISFSVIFGSLYYIIQYYLYSQGNTTETDSTKNTSQNK